jgi:hypothetical protein
LPVYSSLFSARLRSVISSKVVYTSNSGIYGEPKFLPINESHPDDPKTPYDATKLLGEHLGKIYFRIALPLSLPALTVATIWQFTQIWNGLPLGDRSGRTDGRQTVRKAPLS